MQLELTSTEKVLFKANKDFHLKHGDTDQQATEKATNKIKSIRALKKIVAKF